VSDLDAFFADLDTEAGPTSLAVDADLQMDLTTASGSSSTARVTGHGKQIRVDIQRPEVFLAAMERADIGRAADLLAATGMTVTVHGPDGPVATLGAGTSNRFGRVIPGSSRVALLPVAVGRMVRPGRAGLAAAAAVSLALVVLTTVRSLRRRTRRGIL
jgi:hypothetical protein